MGLDIARTPITLPDHLRSSAALAAPASQAHEEVATAVSVEGKARIDSRISPSRPSTDRM